MIIVLKKIFESKGQEVTNDWKKLCSKELSKLRYSSRILGGY
jgi:hypothetical protein